MIDDEQALADETTPLLDAAYNKIDKLLKKLESGDVADLNKWRNETLRPALKDGAANLKKLIGMQLTAANLDLDQAKKNYEAAQRNAVKLLAGGALLVFLWAALIIRSVMRKLGADPGKATEVARRVASGDLQFELQAGRHDEYSLMGALRQMKDNLLQSKLDYEGQINAIAKVQGVVECSPEGGVLNCNEIFLKFMGYELKDVKDKNYSMFVDADLHEANRGLWQSLQRGESRQGEFRLVTFDKREVWVQGVFNPITDAFGKPLNYNKHDPRAFGVMVAATGIHAAAVERLAERAVRFSA
jgi:PAS domain S-box-containing protein